MLKKKIQIEKVSDRKLFIFQQMQWQNSHVVNCPVIEYRVKNFRVVICYLNFDSVWFPDLKIQSWNNSLMGYKGELEIKEKS